MRHRGKSLLYHSFIDYFVIVVVVLSFGTAYLYLYHAGITLLTLLVISVFYKLSNWSSIKFNIFAIVYLLLIPINIFLYGCDMNMIGNIIFLVSSLLIFSSFDYDSFRHKYFNIVIFISLISIFFEVLYILNIISPVLYGSESEGLFGHYIYGYHVFGGGLWGMNNQLYGIFWEPGIYQMVLNLALILNLDLYEKDVRIRFKTIKLCILIITILMTMSTTGYLVLGVVLLGWLFKKSKISLGYIVLISLAIIAFLVVIKYSTVISGKFTEENASYVARSNDLFAFLEIINKYPYWGAGVHSKTYMQIADQLGMTGSQSAGILFQTAQFGMFWILSFFISLISEYKKRRISMGTPFYLLAILFLGLGEPLVYAPLMLIYVLPFKKIKHGKVINNSNSNIQYGGVTS